MNNKKVGILGFLSGVLVYLGFCYFAGLFKKDQS